MTGSGMNPLLRIEPDRCLSPLVPGGRPRWSNSALVSRAPVGSLYRRAVSSAPHAPASPVHAPLRATPRRSAPPSAVPHHDDIHAIPPAVPGNSGPGPEGSEPEHAAVQPPPTVRSKLSLRTSRHPEMPNTNGHRRI